MLACDFLRGRVDLQKKKKYHTMPFLNQRDGATCGFIQLQTHRKPGKKTAIGAISTTPLAGRLALN